MEAGDPAGNGVRTCLKSKCFAFIFLTGHHSATMSTSASIIDMLTPPLTGGFSC